MKVPNLFVVIISYIIKLEFLVYLERIIYKKWEFPLMMVKYGSKPSQKMTLCRAYLILQRGYSETDHVNNIEILKIMQYKSLKTKKNPRTLRTSTPITLCKESQVAKVAKKLYDQAHKLYSPDLSKISPLEQCTDDYHKQMFDIFNIGPQDSSVSIEDLEEILLYR